MRVKTIYNVVCDSSCWGHASIYEDRTVQSFSSKELAQQYALDCIKSQKLYPAEMYDSFEAMMDDGYNLEDLIGLELTDGDSDTLSIKYSIQESNFQ